MWKSTYCMFSTITYDILEKAKLWRQWKKKSSGFQGLEGRKDEETEHRECLGKRNNSAWYYNSGYIVKTNRGYKTKSKLM